MYIFVVNCCPPGSESTRLVYLYHLILDSWWSIPVARQEAVKKIARTLKHKPAPSSYVFLSKRYWQFFLQLQIHLRCKDDLSHASAVAFARLSSIFSFFQQVGCLPADNIKYDSRIIKGTVSEDGFGFWGHVWLVLDLNSGRGHFFKC